MDVSLSVTMTLPKYPDRAKMKKAITQSLRIFDRYYRTKVSQRFANQGPGWAPRAEIADTVAQSRTDKAQALGQHRLALKLARQYRRALKRELRGKGTGVATARRAKIAAEHAAQVAGTASALSPADKKDRRLIKSVANLKERQARATAKASASILGGIGSAMRSRVQGAVLKVTNTVPFSGVLNDGGTVGRGAVLPPRPFNYFDADDQEIFAEIVMNQILIASAA